MSYLSLNHLIKQKLVLQFKTKFFRAVSILTSIHLICNSIVLLNIKIQVFRIQIILHKLINLVFQRQIRKVFIFKIPIMYKILLMIMNQKAQIGFKISIQFKLKILITFKLKKWILKLQGWIIQSKKMQKFKFLLKLKALIFKQTSQKSVFKLKQKLKILKKINQKCKSHLILLAQQVHTKIQKIMFLKMLQKISLQFRKFKDHKLIILISL